ncbi:MAG: hypothetical protein E6J02_07390 [Chloroflexi bacterium]|nr:MAG: hypothetical protein E6J02_07390 [Chloroflexota bacterium]
MNTIEARHHRVTVFEEIPAMRFGVECPRRGHRIAAWDCVGCQYHTATVTSGRGLGVLCRYYPQLAGVQPESSTCGSA